MAGREHVASGPRESAPEAEPAVPMSEVARLIAEAQQSAIESMRETMAKIVADAQKPDPAADPLQSLVDRLATSIGAISGQQLGIKYESPEILVKRTAARQRMFALLDEARMTGETPHYALTETVHFDDMLIPPVWIDRLTKQQLAQEIDWLLPPNHSMRPLNKSAKAIYAAFIDSVQETPAQWEKPKAISPNGLRITTIPISPGEAVTQADDLPRPSMKLLGDQTALRDVRVLGKTAPAAQQAV